MTNWKRFLTSCTSRQIMPLKIGTHSGALTAGVVGVVYPRYVITGRKGVIHGKSMYQCPASFSFFLCPWLKYMTFTVSNLYLHPGDTVNTTARVMARHNPGTRPLCSEDMAELLRKSMYECIQYHKRKIPVYGCEILVHDSHWGTSLPTNPTNVTSNLLTLPSWAVFAGVFRHIQPQGQRNGGGGGVMFTFFHQSDSWAVFFYPKLSVN